MCWAGALWPYPTMAGDAIGAAPPPDLLASDGEAELLLPCAQMHW